MTDPYDRRTATVVEDVLLDTEPYLSCDACFERLDIYVEQAWAQPWYQDLAMQVHLRACDACHEEAATMFELLARWPATPTRVVPSSPGSCALVQGRCQVCRARSPILGGRDREL